MRKTAPTIASNEAAEASLPKTFAPEDSPFLQEILGNEITDSVSAQAEARANAANAEVQSNAILQQNVLADLTELVDDEPLLLLQYAQAAETAQDYATAVTAYEDFLDAAPNNPNAELIEQRVESLKVIAGLDQGGTGDGAAGGSGNSGSDGE